MAKEIERKFLATLPNDIYKSVDITQGYLAETEHCIVRIRTMNDDSFLTIKSMTDDCMVFDEFEYAIPNEDAAALFARCEHHLIKTRHYTLHGSDTWEVDEYHGKLAGLVTAEFEGPSYAAVRDVAIPSFVIREVTGEKEYSNYSLSQR